MSAPAEPETQTEMFNRVARKMGKTTIMQGAPGGAVLIWVTPEEVDPMTALMSIALCIMVKRGQSPDASSGITIRRVTEVVAPGCDVFWQVTDAAGVVIAKGYAATEQDAAAKVAQYVKPNIEPPNDGDMRIII